ncbi:hypothetical protein HDV05_004673 [Chytridiales sp. JEL 0842]|nr:hypothetical protein HDV05_004673 [Chytridiales sp. JEL 0842]
MSSSSLVIPPAITTISPSLGRTPTSPLQQRRGSTTPLSITTQSPLTPSLVRQPLPSGIPSGSDDGDIGSRMLADALDPTTTGAVGLRGSKEVDVMRSKSIALEDNDGKLGADLGSMMITDSPIQVLDKNGDSKGGMGTPRSMDQVRKDSVASGNGLGGASPTFSPIRKKKVQSGPVVRDKYGFKKTFEHVSKEDQDNFDSYYSQCWFYYSGAEKSMDENSGLYHILRSREEQDYGRNYTALNNEILAFINVLEKDLNRTFPENIHFNPVCTTAPSSVNGSHFFEPSHPTPPPETPKPDFSSNPYIRSLRRILVAFAYYSWPHPDESRQPPRSCSYKIGYCQSLNFVVGLLLLVVAQTPDGGRHPLAQPPFSATPKQQPGSKSNATPTTTSSSLNSSHLAEWAASFASGDEETALRVEEKVFWMLVVVVEKLMPPEMYGASLEGAQIVQEVLWKWLLGERHSKFGVSKVAKWVDHMEADGSSPSSRRPGSKRGKKDSSGGGGGGGMPPLSMVTTSWFMTIFVNVLPVETVLRVWDCFFYQGEKVLMRVTLTLLKIHEEQVLACNDTTDAWRLIKEIPPRMTDCHKLMDICFKPRVNFNIFDEGTQINSPKLLHGEDSDGEHSDEETEAGLSSPVLQNDPLRQYAGSMGSGKVGSGENGNVRYYRHGVGSVSSKMIAHYRMLALQERRERRA